jgi:hypothetical protein
VVGGGLEKEGLEVVYGEKRIYEWMCEMGKGKELLLSNSHSLVQSTHVVGENNHPFVFLRHGA